MLQLSRENIEPFSEDDLMRVLERGGLHATLPRNLTDSQLLCVCDQLHEILWGKGATRCGDAPSAAVAIALLLIANVSPDSRSAGADFQTEVDMVRVRESLILLSITADREIVNRLLNRPGKDDPLDLVHGIEAIMAAVNEPSKSTSRKIRKHPRARACAGLSSRT